MQVPFVLKASCIYEQFETMSIALIYAGIEVKGEYDGLRQGKQEINA
jgi:hypothetical protein